MNEGIVDSAGPVTLIGGGQAEIPDLRAALALAPVCVAADGGAALADAAGVVPDAVIGDFDSLPLALRRALPQDRLHHVAEQSSTDFDKALSRVAAPLVLGVGFTGGRIDHQLGAFHTLLCFAHRTCVLMGRSELVFVAPPRIALPTQADDTVSLFPLVPVTGQSTGLEWPIAGLAFAPGRQSGTSNRATGPVTLVMDAPGMLVIVPRRLLEPLTDILMQADAPRWPG